MSYDTGDEAQVKERKTKAQLEREKELVYLNAVLETRAGRAFLWRAINTLGLYRQSSTANPHETYFKEGQRSAAMWLRKEIIEADPHAYLKMQTEAGDP